MKLALSLLLGVAGLALSIYSTDKTLILLGSSEAHSGQIILLGLTAVLMAVAGAANLLTAWALSFGRMSSVLGSLDSPILVDANGTRRHASSIRIKKNLNEGQNQVPESSQVVIFVCGWKPWSCPASNFLKQNGQIEARRHVPPHRDGGLPEEGHGQ